METAVKKENQEITQGSAISAKGKGVSPDNKDFAETMETLHSVLQELKQHPLFKEPAEEVDNLYQKFQDQFRDNRIIVVYVTQQQQEKSASNQQEPVNLWKDFQTVHEDIKKASLNLKQSVRSIPERMEAAIKEKIQQTIQMACGKVVEALNKGIAFLNRQREKVEAVRQTQQIEQPQPEKGPEVTPSNSMEPPKDVQRQRRISKSEECLHKIMQPQAHTALSAPLHDLYRNEYKRYMEQGIPRQDIDEKVAMKMLLTGKYTTYNVKETIKKCSPEAALTAKKEQYAKSLLQRVQTREVKQQMQQAQAMGR